VNILATFLRKIDSAVISAQYEDIKVTHKNTHGNHEEIITQKDYSTNP